MDIKFMSIAQAVFLKLRPTNQTAYHVSHKHVQLFLQKNTVFVIFSLP